MPATMMPAMPTMNSRRSAVGIEHLAEFADLVEPAGQPAVHPVRGAQATQQECGPGNVVAPEQHPQEQRNAAQPSQREQVRRGEELVRRQLG
jgi:hypothetical protein